MYDGSVKTAIDKFIRNGFKESSNNPNKTPFEDVIFFPQ